MPGHAHAAAAQQHKNGARHGHQVPAATAVLSRHLQPAASRGQAAEVPVLQGDLQVLTLQATGATPLGNQVAIDVSLIVRYGFTFVGLNPDYTSSYLVSSLNATSQQPPLYGVVDLGGSGFASTKFPFFSE
ncbi:MAG: hypothetical protein WDW36_000137 [Sanguina aurantia]